MCESNTMSQRSSIIQRSLVLTYLLIGLFLTPLAIQAQNQGPSLVNTIPQQLLQQDGDSVQIDLKNYFSDPDVADPAVQINVRLGAETKPIYLRFLNQEAPLSVANFKAYIEAGHYEDNFIHRSVPGFVIQGGGFRFTDDQTIDSVPTFDPVLNEPGVSNIRGTVAMAKQAGDPNSATSQWFVSLDDNSTTLDGQNGGFTVFAEVLAGSMTVVDEIASQAVYDASSLLGSGAFEDLPLTAASLNREYFIETSARLIYPIQFTALSGNPDLVAALFDENGLLTLTPSSFLSGETQVTVVATDLEGAQRETSFDVSVSFDPESYAEWEELHDFANAATSEPGENPDGDALNNLLEFALNRDPVLPDDSAHRIQVLANGDLRLTIRRNTELEIEVQRSTDVQIWDKVWDTREGVLAPAVANFDIGEGVLTLILRGDAPLGFSSGRYWRIVVRQP